MGTLWERWEQQATARGSSDAVVLWHALRPPERRTWEGLIEEARRAAGALARLGVRPGDVCGLMLRHTIRFHAIYMGLSALGAIPSVLAYPNSRLHPDKFVHGLTGMAQRSGLRWLLTERDLEGVVSPLVSSSASTIQGLLFPLEADFGEAGPVEISSQSDAPCLLQHSSGTTGLQKAVMLSHHAVLEHVARYGDTIGATAADKVASWLPLYHDMGLIAAFHLPLALGIPIVQLDPFEWVAAPGLLLDAISQERASLCWLPNFAYNLMAARLREEDVAGLDLSCVRMLINCSEPVRADSHARLLRRLAAVGLRESSLSTCYAMAETTFAVTQTHPGRAATVVQADRDALAAGRYEPCHVPALARARVSSGRPISGCEVRIADPDGVVASEGAIGEIEVRSASMFDGYRNDAEATAEAFRDGWYRTGDYGFVADGEYYVIGRRKDLIIVAGKNLYPEDIEDAVGQVAGVIAGRVIAFGEDDEELGTETVSVVVETALESGVDRKLLKRAIITAGMAIDVTIRRVYLAPPRWLIKSSSGKPSRKANRTRLNELVEGK